MVQVLSKNTKKFQIDVYGWVILDNHYHLLAKLDSEEILRKFIKNFHGESSVILNKSENKAGRQIWVNYWDRCIRSERDFYTRLNYLHHNPVKHGYTKEMEDYEFSSYRHYLEKNGLEWLNDCFRNYPIIDFTEDSDNL